MGLNIKWDITYKCNLYCAHCINGKLLRNHSKDLETNEIFNIIDKISSSVKVDYIHLLGGEPTCRKDLVEVTNYLSKKNIDFGFNTNCINFVAEKNKELLLNKNFRNLVVSLEGPTAEINDLIRGKNVFDKTIKNLQSIIEFKKNNDIKQLKVIVNTVVSRTNYESIIDMIDFCIALGVDELDLLQLIVQGNAEQLTISMNPEEELQLVERIAKKYGEIKDKITIIPKFVRPMVKDYCKEVLGLPFPEVYHGCSAGMTFMFMNNEGYIYPCDRYLSSAMQGVNEDRFNLAKNEFFQVIKEKEFDIPFQNVESLEYETKYEPCNKCSHLKKDCFPCFLIFDELETPYHINNCDLYLEKIEEHRSAAKNLCV